MKTITKNMPERKKTLLVLAWVFCLIAVSVLAGCNHKHSKLKPEAGQPAVPSTGSNPASSSPDPQNHFTVRGTLATMGTYASDHFKGSGSASFMSVSQVKDQGKKSLSTSGGSNEN